MATVQGFGVHPSALPPPHTSYHRPYTTSPLQASDLLRPPSAPRWYYNPWKIAAAFILPYAVYRSLTIEEIVPYTNRVHRVLPYPSDEHGSHDVGIDLIKKRHGDKILSPSDPKTVRVCRIANDIICGIDRVLLTKSQRGEDDSGSSLKDPGPIPNVNRNKQEKAAAVTQPHTGHLKELNWKVFVVRDKRQISYSTGTGKIVVFTGLLDHLDTDDEIANLLAHEMGHVVAGHFFEFHNIVEYYFIPFLSRLLPFSRRIEIEADHIGIMLLAAAGFDPRVAPGFYQKLGAINGDSAWKDYMGSHPSCRTRSRLLSQGKIMDEALEMYQSQVRVKGSAK